MSFPQTSRNHIISTSLNSVVVQLCTAAQSALDSIDCAPTYWPKGLWPCDPCYSAVGVDVHSMLVAVVIYSEDQLLPWFQETPFMCKEKCREGRKGTNKQNEHD